MPSPSSRAAMLPADCLSQGWATVTPLGSRGLAHEDSPANHQCPALRYCSHKLGGSLVAEAWGSRVPGVPLEPSPRFESCMWAAVGPISGVRAVATAPQVDIGRDRASTRQLTLSPQRIRCTVYVYCTAILFLERACALTDMLRPHSGSAQVSSFASL